MGSFNTICMVSQQIIKPGDDAVILPIKQASGYNPVEISKDNDRYSPIAFASTTCYPSAFWTYCGPMIKGEYDDYGRFSIFNTPSNETNLIQFFNYLHNVSYKTDAGENKYHDLEFDMQALYTPKQKYSFKELVNIWDKMWDVASEHRVFISNYKNDPRNLQFAVMHESAAQYLIDSVSKYKDYDGKSYEQKTYFKNYISGNIKRVIDVLKNKKDLLKDDGLFTTVLIMMGSLNNYRIGEQEGSSIGNYYSNMDNMKEVMKKYDFKKETEEGFDKLIDELFEIYKSQLDHRYIHVGLDSLNLKLSPMVYGPQDYDNESGRAYTKMIKSVSATISKKNK